MLALIRKGALSATIAAVVVTSMGQTGRAAGVPIIPLHTSLELHTLTGMSGAPALPKPLDVLPSPIVQGQSVGYLPGNWTVGDSGAFLYSIAIDVPDGHLTPALGLSYSSANRSNGELGVGWTLAGPSAITRCGENLTVDGAVAAEGHFCLDGQKLVAVPEGPGLSIGVNGAPGTQYRTESDSYARITTTGTVAGAPERFKVELRSGVVREYRAVKVPEQSGSFSSVIAPYVPGDALQADAVVDYAVGAAVTDRWVLDTETDPSGNRLAYDWSDPDVDAINPQTLGIEVHLKGIRYMRADEPTVLFRQVTIEYEDRPDNGDFTWHLGVRSELRHRIASITAYAPSPRAMAPVWRYTMGYSPSLSRNGRSLLTSVQRCGMGAPAAVGGISSGGVGGCLFKKEFSWWDENPSSTPVPTFASHMVKTFNDPVTWPIYDAKDPGSWANLPLAIVRPPVAHVLDLDGDGTDDLVLQTSVGKDQLPTHIFRGQRLADGTATALSQYSPFDGAVEPGGRRDYVLLQTARPVDLENVGRDKLLTIRQVQGLDPQGNPDGSWTYEEKLFEWGTNGFGPSDLPPLFGIYEINPRRFNFVDLDGDKRLDMVVESEGADSGSGPPFFWWNKTWEVWMNQGGTLVKTGTVPLETKCPSQITDADGDGRGEFIQLYDHDDVIGKSTGGVPWATEFYDANGGLPGYKQYECTAIGYLSADAAGQPVVKKEAPLVAVSMPTPDAARANASRFERHEVPDITYGDFNADGLEDEFSTQYDAAGQVLHAWVRWNTGKGYGPRQEVQNFFPAGVDVTWQVRELVADFDGDGKDDLLSLRRPDGNGQPTLVMALSDGKGGFSQTVLDGGPGLFEALETYTTTRIGDFDGDGRPDLIGFTDPQTLVVRLQKAQYNERLVTVADEFLPWDSVTAVYSNQWSNKPEPTQACAYPLACVRHGSTVVREVRSREHLVNPTPEELSNANADTTYYSYEDPVMHQRGRGHLGFRKVRQWNPKRPIEVVKEYDNRTEVGRGYYPGVAMPVQVTTVVPFATVGGTGHEAPPDMTGPSKPTSLLAHVVQTTTQAQVQALNKAQANDAWGLTYDVHAENWITSEWEQTVMIDWSNATSEHLSSAAPNPPLYSGQTPVSLLRVQSGSAKYDDFGNLTHGQSEVVGAQSVTVDSQFKNLTQSWQIGQLYSQLTTRSDGQSQTTSSEEFTYDPQTGYLTDAYRDKGNADPSIPAATHLDYDPWGNVTSIAVTALNDAKAQETRQTRFEYAPIQSGWADEHLYPSQIWSPGVTTYQPSVWMAVYPAYGVPVTVMDANGKQAHLQYDDLGRVVKTQSDGEPAGTLFHAGRPDTGGFNGLVVSSTVLGQDAQVETDALGRTLQEGYRAFDGMLRYTQRRYDGLHRLKSVSRPYAQGATPSDFTTYAYDALDRIVKLTAPDNTFSQRTYPNYFETHTFDANNNESIAVRDVLDRLIRSSNVLNGKSITTTYHYGLFGVEDVTDPANHVTHTEYNARGLPVLQDTPDTGRTTVAYTGFAQVWQTLHQSTGDQTRLQYDGLGRLIHRVSPDGDSEFRYDTAPNGLGRLAQAQSPDKVINRMGYDPLTGRLNQMEQQLDGITDRVALNFDALSGHLMSVDYPSVDGSLTPGLSVLYQYNPTGYVDTVSTQQPGQAAHTIWNVTARNLDGALLTATQGWGGQMAVSRHYAPQVGRLDAMTVLQGNQKLLDMGYGYRPNGLVQSREDKVVQRQEHFDYDALLRLTHADLTYGGTVHNTYYGYDPIGNLLSVDGEQHLLGQAVPLLKNIESNLYGSNNVAFPQPHTLTSHTEGGVTDHYTYDTHGRRNEGAGLNAVFTAFDLPKTIRKAGQTWTYTYDAFGAKVKEQAPDGSATSYVAGMYERRTAPGKDTLQVFHVQGTDGAIADIVYNATPPKTYTPNYILEDELGSTSVVIDGAGGIERKHYDPFGKRINPDGTSYAGPASFITSGFTSHEEEAALGLINMRGRMYDPKTKRFLTADLYVTHPGFGQSWNPYSYVLNSPLNFTDPSGYKDEQTCSNLADLSQCYPNTPSGNGLAPGTDDFNACKSCNADGSAKNPWGNGGEDANHQVNGPGFYNQGPKDGVPANSSGAVGSRVAQSGQSGYTAESTAIGGAGGNVGPWQLFNNSLQPHVSFSQTIRAVYYFMHQFGQVQEGVRAGSISDATASRMTIVVPNSLGAGGTFEAMMIFLHEAFHLIQELANVNQGNISKQTRADYANTMMRNEQIADTAMFTALGELFQRAQNPSDIRNKEFYENANLMFIWGAIDSPAGRAWTQYIIDHVSGASDSSEQWRLAQGVAKSRVEGDAHRKTFEAAWDFAQWKALGLRPESTPPW